MIYLHTEVMWVIVLAGAGLIGLRQLICLWKKKRRRRFKQYWVFTSLPEEIRRRLICRGYWFHLPKILLILASIPFWIALADPVVMGRKVIEYEEKRQLVISLDFSGSMTVGMPKPFDLAKEAVKKLLARRTQSPDQYALMVFSDNAYLISAFTRDFDYYRFLLDSVDFSQYGESGTRIDVAVESAKTYFIRHGDKNVKHRVLVMFSDADSNTDPTVAILQAKREGMAIYLIGIGAQNTDNGKKMIATVEKAGGAFFTGENALAIEEAVRKIDRIETSRVLTAKVSGPVPLFERWARLTFFLIVGVLLLMISPWFRDFP